MIVVICLVILVAIVGFGLWAARDECPRMIRGYNCKGSDKCDHSAEEVRQAKIDMGINNGGRNGMGV